MRAHTFFIALIFATTPILATHHRLVVFGDSATDGGNSPPAVVLKPTFSYPATPYSNGAVWVTKLGNFWSDILLPSTLGGLNYSFAGAQSSTERTFELAELKSPTKIAAGKIFVPSLKSQVNEFLSQRKDVSKKSIVIYAPGNTDFAFHRTTPIADALLASSDTINALQSLKNAGYKNQVVLQTAAVFSSDLAVFADTFNSTLLTGLNSNSLTPVVIDKAVFDSDILHNLSFYGFTKLGPMETSTGPNNTVFWFDDVHHSELTNSLFAEYVYNILEAPVGWGQLALQPFALMRGQNVSLRQELYPITSFCQGKVYPFITGNYIPVEQAPGISTSANGWNTTVGAAIRALDHWTVGAAGSYNRNSSKNRTIFGHYEYTLHSWMFSLFSGFQKDRGYLNTFGNIGWMGFDDIQRKFSMGPKNWRATGETNGMQYDLLLEGGWYFFRNDDCQLGPIITLEYQHADIDGYTEQNASYNDLQYKSQHPNSFITGLGIEAVLWKPWKKECDSGYSMEMFFSINEQWLENEEVQFRQVSVGSNAPFGDWQINQTSTFFLSYGLTMSYAMENSAIFNWGYRGSWGQNHMFEQNVTANLTIPIVYKGEQKERKGKCFR